MKKENIIVQENKIKRRWKENKYLQKNKPNKKFIFVLFVGRGIRSKEDRRKIKVQKVSKIKSLYLYSLLAGE